jgi:hypothetical protein
MTGINKTLAIEIAIIAALSLLSFLGITRPAAPVAPITILVGASSPRLVATVYGADWCVPCRTMQNNVRREMPKDGWIVRDSTEKDSGTAHILFNHDAIEISKLKIISIPTVVFRVDGKEVKRITGGISPDDLAKEYNRIAEKHAANDL